jgi:F-type H+-transporting ATPase subunit b
LPQFDSSTFASQIFWAAIGFSLVYLFVSRVFVPKTEQVFSERDFHIEAIRRTAHLLKKEADRMERITDIELENAQISIAEAESKIVSGLREQSLKEKENLYNSFSEKSRIESESILQSSDEIFVDTVNNIDEFVDTAIASIFRSSKEKP